MRDTPTRRIGFRAWLVACALPCAGCSTTEVSAPRDAAQQAAPTVVSDRIPAPLVARGGDAARGRALILAPSHDPANCVLCHSVPEQGLAFAGDLGPSLAGVGTRLDIGQLRLRVVDNARVNASTIMPSYFRTEGLRLVAPAYRDRTILSAAEVEDVVAYLATLR